MSIADRSKKVSCLTVCVGGGEGGGGVSECVGEGGVCHHKL